MFKSIRELYLQSRKPHDIFWNTYVCRPIAAVVIHFIRKTSITPNQVTFVSLLVALVGAVVMAMKTGQLWLFVAVAIFEASYVLDCADGQLARVKKMSSPVGAHLDFLMDELKAYALIAAMSIRLAEEAGNYRMLVIGVVGLAIVASAISLTTFIRRPEYAPPRTPTGYAPPPAQSTSIVGRMIRLAEATAQTIAHYPTCLVLVAAVNRLDIFFYLYIGVHCLYVLRSFAQIALKLARPGPAPVAVISDATTRTIEEAAPETLASELETTKEAAVLASLDQDVEAITIRMPPVPGVPNVTHAQAIPASPFSPVPSSAVSAGPGTTEPKPTRTGSGFDEPVEITRPLAMRVPVVVNPEVEVVEAKEQDQMPPGDAEKRAATNESPAADRPIVGKIIPQT